MFYKRFIKWELPKSIFISFIVGSNLILSAEVEILEITEVLRDIVIFEVELYRQNGKREC